MHRLKFGRGNGKLSMDTATFSLPAGWTCPGAQDCLARLDRKTGKLTDGPKARFRCFAASMEVRPNVRAARWHNLELLRSARTQEKMAKLILHSLPCDAKRVRVHVSGDFFSQTYFNAWREVAEHQQGMVFYAYTKSVHLLPPRDRLPHNFRIVVSEGTRYLLPVARELGYSVARVEFEDGSELPVDHDDTLAVAADRDFALLLHGVQAAGSEAATALRKLRAAGWNGYRRNK